MKSSWRHTLCSKYVFDFLRCFKFEGGWTRPRLAGEGGAGLAAVHLHKLSGDAFQVRGAPSQDAGVAQGLPGELQHYFRSRIFFKWHISMGVRRTVFWGGQTILWTGQKAILTLFIPKFLFKLAIVSLKLHKCQIPGPGKYLVLPIGADAHAYLLFIWKNWTIKGIYIFLPMSSQNIS